MSVRIVIDLGEDPHDELGDILSSLRGIGLYPEVQIDVSAPPSFPRVVYVVNYSSRPGDRFTTRAFLTESDAYAFQDSLAEDSISELCTAPIV